MERGGWKGGRRVEKEGGEGKGPAKFLASHTPRPSKKCIRMRQNIVRYPVSSQIDGQTTPDKTYTILGGGNN